MILSRPVMSSMPGQEWPPDIQFSMESGFATTQQSGPYDPVSSQDLQDAQRKNSYQDSTSPDEGDTDMAGTPPGSIPTSPENYLNEEGVKSHESDAVATKPMTAIPEYFANKKTKDGKIPKKRGPKPDSKPARDRRQELNRQAQRNHRHRKEEQQKWLEEALAEAHEKARAAMRRAHEAEELHQRMSCVHDQSQRENERLKQLLDVNKIPFEHVIPQTVSFGTDRPEIAQQSHRGSIDPTTSTTPISTSASQSSELLPQTSDVTDTNTSDSMYHSDMSPMSPLDNPDQYDPHASIPQNYSYGQSGTNRQFVSNVGLPRHELTGLSSDPNMDSASAMAHTSVKSSTQLGPISPLQTKSTVTDSTVYDYSSIGSNQPYPAPRATGYTSTEPGPTLGGPDLIRDHDQIGVEFILALEANCHDHKTLMNARTFSDPVQLGGHSMMLSKVPNEVAKHYRHGDAPHPHGPPDVGEGPGKYARLLSLVSLEPQSTNKDLEMREGEISPAQALGFIRRDPRYNMLDTKDFAKITNALKERSRCYGFGAVVEIYEVTDVLNKVFNEKGYGPEQGFDRDDLFFLSIPRSYPHTFNGPEYPNLDALMEVNLAALMRTRQTDREQALAADLSSFDAWSSSIVNVENLPPLTWDDASNDPWGSAQGGTE